MKRGHDLKLNKDFKSRPIFRFSLILTLIDFLNAKILIFQKKL